VNPRNQGRRKIIHFFHGIGISLGRLTPVARCQGSFGEIGLFRHPELGKVFVLGKEIQHVEAWAPLYHEPLVHLPASFIKKVRNVLILGGGTLFAASEALKYKSVQRLIVVDHDPQVAKTVARYYAHAKKCFHDRRFTLIEGDAYATLPQLGQKFDLVINDGADLLGAKPRLRSKEHSSNLFSLMQKALSPAGVCCDVVYRHVFERSRTIRTLNLLAQHAHVAFSLVFLPEYHGVLHLLFIWGGTSSTVRQTAKGPTNTEQLIWRKNPSRSPCLYYDPRFLAYYLYLPRYIKKALGFRRKVA
jgi:spermidine synthase